MTLNNSDAQVKRLEPLRDDEVAVEASVVLPDDIEIKRFSACVPQESIPFDGKVPAEWETKIFESKALQDMAKCSASDCAFNLLPTEIHSLTLLKNDTDRKNFYLDALQNRIHFKLGIDPARRPHFITSKDKGFSPCGEGEVIESLLNTRPLRDLPFRLSHAKYNKKMRPTTRLTQGVFWSPKKGETDRICYAEALIFSDHYDVDRVEVWSLQGRTLTLQIRNRLDLLNTWLRRLNKEKFWKEATSVAENQIKGALECFKAKK